MSDAFTRRGFTRAAVLGAAALWLPKLARADASLRARMVATATPDGLSVSLWLTSDEAVTVAAQGVILAGQLQIGEDRYGMELNPDLRRALMSRAGPRIRTSVMLQKDREALFETFFGQWPGGASAGAARGRGTLAVGLRAAHPARRATLGPLRGLRASARIA